MPVKLAIVVVMLMFLYNIGMTIWKARRLTTTEGVLVAGLALAALLYLPALLTFDNYTAEHLLPLVDRAPLGRGGVGDDPGRPPGLPAHPALRGRPRGDGKVALRHRGAHLHRRHPRHRAPLLLDRRAALLAGHRRVLQRARAAGLPGHGDLRVHGHPALRAGAPEPPGAALDHRKRHLLRAGRRHSGTGTHLAFGEQVDARHHDHRRCTGTWPSSEPM